MKPTPNNWTGRQYFVAVAERHANSVRVVYACLSLCLVLLVTGCNSEKYIRPTTIAPSSPYAAMTRDQAIHILQAAAKRKEASFDSKHSYELHKYEGTNFVFYKAKIVVDDTGIVATIYHKRNNILKRDSHFLYYDTEIKNETVSLPFKDPVRVGHCRYVSSHAIFIVSPGASRTASPYAGRAGGIQFPVAKSEIPQLQAALAKLYTNIQDE